MVTRYIPTLNGHHNAASAWAKANASDPFAYSRCLTHLKNNCHSQGLASDILADSERILKARSQSISEDK